MINEKETVKCEAVFNDDRTHRFLWKQVWNKDKPLACVVMLNPCAADCIIYDTTTYLVVNNIASLETYGGVEIVNIYSKLTSKLNLRWDSDEELNDSDNDTYIKKAAAECDTVVLAWGTGAITNKRVLERVKDVLAELKPFAKKLYVITDGDEMRAVHPLTPQVRNTWVLEPFKASDIEVPVKPRVTKPKSIETEEQADDNSSDAAIASDGDTEDSAESITVEDDNENDTDSDS